MAPADRARRPSKVWRSRDGALRVEDLVPLLGPKTRLVTVSLVSFFNGFRLQLPEVVAAVRKHSPALLAVDVTQALGRIPLDLAGADLIVSSTHKWILASHGGGLVGVPAARAAEWTVPAGGWFNLEDAFGAEPVREGGEQAGRGELHGGDAELPGGLRDPRRRWSTSAASASSASTGTPGRWCWPAWRS